jgi:hypothetical protein
MDSQFFKGTALDDSMILTYAVIDGSTSKLYRCQLNYSTTESMTLVAANLADTYSVDTFVDINTEKLSYAYVSSSNTSFPIQFGGEEYSSQINIEESTSPPSYPFGLSRLRMTKLENGQYCIGFAKMTATTSIIHTLKVLEGTTILNETSNVTVNAANSQPLISSTLVSNQNSCAYITWRNYATSYGMAAVGYEEIAAGVPAWFSGSLTDEISDLKATFDPGGNLRVVYAKDGGFEEMKYLKISKTLDAAYAATSVSLNTLNFSTTSGFLAGTQFIGGSGRLIMVESKSTGSTPANALNFYTLE